MAKYEYGVIPDCATEGCDPPHEDDPNKVWFRGPTRANLPKSVNWHAVKPVRRLINEWEDDPGDS